MTAASARFDAEIARLLGSLRQEVARIKRRNTATNAEAGANLAHFTKHENLIRMLENYRDEFDKRSEPAREEYFLSLWLSDISCLNDPLEGKALFQFVDDGAGRKPKQWGAKSFSSSEWNDLEKIVAWLRGGYSDHSSGKQVELSRRVLICSFTQDRDRLDLWRAYGENATGICLSMPLTEALARIKDSPVSPLFYVRYLDEEKAAVWTMLANHLRPIYAKAKKKKINSKAARDLRAKVIEECEQIFHLYKHEQYQNEHEMRLVTTLDTAKVADFGDREKPFARGMRPDLKLNRIYAYSDPFFLGSENCSVILGSRVHEADRLAATLSSYFRQLWPKAAPSVQLSKVPYR